MASTCNSWWEGDIFRMDFKTSVDTPNYSYLVSQGLALPDNPFSHQGEWIGSDYVETGIWAWNGTLNRYQHIANDSTRLEAPGIGITPFDWGPADNAFLSKVKQASVSVITMFAERKSTAALLETFAGNILYTLIHWRKPNKVLARWLHLDKKVRKWATRKLERRILRCTTPAEAWLEYRFAVRPMMGDIRDALEAFEKGSQKQHVTHISRKGGQEGTRVRENLGPYGTITGQLHTRYDWKIVGRFAVTDPSLAALGNLADIGTSLWDLLPFSFVVDWAWDISTYLDLQNATLGLDFLSGYKGLRSTYTRTYKTVPVLSYPYRYTPMSDYAATWNSLYYRRTVLTSCPTPYLRRETAEAIFGDGHIYDMLALARQIWSGKAKATYHFSN